ncbi:recombination associated protein RdgC [Glaciecola punicea ACAM 611]|uniref:Recombination-associated protein RdgC n=1 Tax=Glaciecola punicea ACAM 611 TaxID=1121923 RepID=H5T8G6_9ALTE|nr:recombination-associated protein RdgC [Glaciecola punicea]GAB54607.1 recombination associated protein RdgC [Glaciecola punicea ACAM 611]
MWFKNLKVYRFTSKFAFDEEQLQAMLESMPFRPCSSQDIESKGWISPIPKAENLYHKANQDFLFSLKREQKLLPASVINSELIQKVGEVETETGSPMPKKAQKDLKEEITQRLLPRAFSKFGVTNAFVSIDQQIVVVDASSDNNAEAVLSCLRKCIGSLPVVPFSKTQQQEVLTDWLIKDVPAGFEILNEAEFQSTAEDGGTIRCKNQDLDAQEVLNHVQAGKMVHKLAISFQEKLTCIIAEDLSVKRLKFTDIVLEQNEDIEKENVALKIDADFMLFSSEVKAFIAELDTVFSLSEGDAI